MKTFTVDQIKTWLMKQDSLGDAAYNCTEEKLELANKQIVLKAYLFESTEEMEQFDVDIPDREPFAENTNLKFLMAFIAEFGLELANPQHEEGWTLWNVHNTTKDRWVMIVSE